MANQQYAAGDVNNERNTGAVNQTGTYRDPLSGARETATSEAGADALVRLGWVKTTEDDAVITNRDQILKALDLDGATVGFRGDNGDQSGNTSQEAVEETRRAAEEQSRNIIDSSDKKGNK